MKNKILIIIVIMISIFTSACKNEHLEKEIPTIKIGWNRYYDYTKYFDMEALNDIKFGKVAYAERINVPTKYNGYTYKYINDNYDNIYVIYSIDNPLLIDEIYYMIDGLKISTTPLIYNQNRYMTINYWKNMHPLFFENEISNTDSIKYRRIQDFSLVEKKDIIDWGLSDEKMELILTYYKYIPFTEISTIYKENSDSSLYTKYRVTLLNYNKCLFNNVNNRYYYFQFNNDGTFSFYDNSERYIISNNIVNEKYYYYEQVEIYYVTYFTKKVVDRYLNKNSMISLESFSSYKNDENKYKLKYSDLLYSEIRIDKETDTITIEKIIYGENVLYENTNN